ncbi:uncharacterized protein TNCV_2847361 [Trichonephila clavipes]|nr:uncharacterized protein TNCV_2847361 [Trichonephila clavipes]
MESIPTRRLRLQSTRLVKKKKNLYFFEKKEHVVACIDVKGLMNFMNISYDTNDCRLFIDSSKLSLKAVLLHKGDLLPSIRVEHSIYLKETYANVKLLLKLIKYKDHKWQICGDLSRWFTHGNASGVTVVVADPSESSIIHWGSMGYLFQRDPYNIRYAWEKPDNPEFWDRWRKSFVGRASIISFTLASA